MTRAPSARPQGVCRGLEESQLREAPRLSAAPPPTLARCSVKRGPAPVLAEACGGCRWSVESHRGPQVSQTAVQVIALGPAETGLLRCGRSPAGSISVT